MSMSLALIVHIFLAILWVGGMAFAHVVLRPSSEFLDLKPRVLLWHGVLGRFLPLVWVAVVGLPLSGYTMIFVGFGGLAAIGPAIWVMQVVGWWMIGLFLYVYFKPYQRLRYMVKEELFPEAGLYMLRIRRIMLTNLILGTLVVLFAAGGRYW
ncbi:MAG: hypothetical protein G8345_11070 [Magnetococcales bacterium]|nr:hypothetical protein [Magnetococcales bacterium]NGZ27414.1 hypothetical protein [Magnetococcales bacterium]